MLKLTKRQQEVLELIRQNIEDTGYPPTRVEIAQKLGFRSANAAEDHIKALAKKGAIEIVPGASRGIRLPQSDIPDGLPIIGQVAAGNPILGEENIEEWLEEVPHGWMAFLNLREHVVQELSTYGLDQFFVLGGTLDDIAWRTKKPEILFTKVNEIVSRRLDF